MDAIYRALHSPFSIETHKATFTNYLEVIVCPDGTVEYAVPSHVDRMEEVYCRARGITRQQAIDEIPREYWYDTLGWYAKASGCVAVWNDFTVGAPNQAQVDSISALARAGLYLGKVPLVGEKSTMRYRLANGSSSSYSMS